MAYTPEVEAKIKALKAELKELEGMKREKITLVNIDELKELENLTGGSVNDFKLRVSWLSRMASCGASVRKRCNNGNLIDVVTIKPMTELSCEETDTLEKCAREVMDVLLKYARQIKQEGENDNTAI